MNELILCLSIAIFRESRGEPLKGKYAVAEVIHNRTQHPSFPDNYCDVIKQKSQFSFYRSPKDLKPPKHEQDAWNDSLKVAKDFYKKKTNYTKGSLYFNHQRLGVRFKITNDIGKPIKYGNHVFF